MTGDERRVACASEQAGWLFDAVLAGYGLCGVIVEAALALDPPPAPFVRTVKTSLADLAGLEDALSDDSPFHATAFRTEGGWSVARTWAVEEDTATTFESFVAPSRADADAGEARFMAQAILPRGALAGFLSAAGRLEGSVQVHAVRPPSRGLRYPRVVGDLAFIVTLISARDANDEVRAAARAAGGEATLLGAFPQGERAWRDQIGPAAFDALLRAKALADPAAVLGAARLAPEGAAG